MEKKYVQNFWVRFLACILCSVTLLAGTTAGVCLAGIVSFSSKEEMYLSGRDEIAENYAAYIALTRNRMREQVTYIYDSNNKLESTLYKAILHKENEGNGTGGVNESGNDIIEWYLPSKEEATNLKETGTGTEATPISPLNGTYWSSTAGVDPDANAGITNGYAYSYTYTNNNYSSNNSEADRATEYKVRAVRKK